MTPELIRKYIFAKAYGATVLELAVDNGTAQLEHIAEWPRSAVDAAKAAIAKGKSEAAGETGDEDASEPPADVIAEIRDEAQAYADARGESVGFLLRWINVQKKPVSTRAFRLEPSAANKKRASFSDGAALQSLLDAVLKSNEQIIKSHEAGAKATERTLDAVQKALEVITKQKLEPVQHVAEPVRELTPEELEDLRASAELKRNAAAKVGDGIDLLIGIGAKLFKLGEAETALLTAGGQAVARAMNGAETPTGEPS
jgi:hypothetical protein